MNNFKITLNNIQHIQHLEYEIDLSTNSLHCIVGKNAVGKTTLIKAIENFKDSNALDKLSRLNIITSLSNIIYTVDDQDIIFNPILDNSRYVLDSTTPIDETLKSNIFTELPIPIGKRFDIYEKLGGDIGTAIKTKFALSDYDIEPTELIGLFKSIYGDDRFKNLKQIDIKGDKYYIKPLNDKNYIREDDFSSGEYMIVQIYKLMQKKCKLIVIDELDISLDSSAQVNLLKVLKELTERHEINLLFTTHSLAIMKLMEDDLYYMETVNEVTTIQKKSYNYIKSLLFQFEGYDKIILTEDEMLVNYIEYLLKDEQNLFSKYKIIYIAGHSQTVDLMERNKEIQFLGTNKVISLLDGDQSRTEKYQGKDNIKFIPFESIEKDLYQSYLDEELNTIINGHYIDTNSINSARGTKKSKVLYNNLTGRGYMTNTQIIEVINAKYEIAVELLRSDLIEFLN